jgi:hypothetical protein
MYEPLRGFKSIRLVKLHPSPDNDSTIVCHIECESLDFGRQAPPYEALSYVWGDPDDEYSIEISRPSVSLQGELGTSLQVRRNLHAALRRLRYPDRIRTMWIDAICINQQDDKEKTQQVKMMKDIYSNAQGVLIWLGDDDEVTAEEISSAFETVSKVESKIRDMHKIAEFNDNPILRSSTTVVNLTNGYDHESYDIWVALTRVFQRPWFSRIWVIQEAAMAKRATFIWGAKSVPWETLLGAAEAIKLASLQAMLPVDRAAIGIDTLVNMGAFKRRISEGNLMKDAFSMMSFTRNQLATNPLDKLNAILGFLDPRIAPSPIYGIDVPMLYRDLAIKWLLTTDKPLLVLAAANGGIESSYPSLPSWIPDWTQRDVPRSLASFDIFNTCGESRPEFSLSDCKSMLRIMGKKVALIKEVGEPYTLAGPNVGIPESGVELVIQTRIQMRKWYQECDAIFSRNNQLEIFEDRIDYYWRVLICNRTISGKIPESDVFKDFLAFAKFYGGDFLSDLRAPMSSDVIQQQVNAGFYEGILKYWCTGRVFFAASNSRFGWAPRGTGVGDVVCVLFGSIVPFILRPLSAPGQYRLIGECYLYDFMDGEAVNSNEYLPEPFILI